MRIAPLIAVPYLSVLALSIGWYFVTPETAVIGDSIAFLTTMQGKVEYRPKLDNYWYSAIPLQGFAKETFVATLAHSSAEIDFSNGQRIALGEQSQIKISVGSNKDNSDYFVTVIDGKVNEVKTKAKPLSETLQGKTAPVFSLKERLSKLKSDIGILVGSVPKEISTPIPIVFKTPEPDFKPIRHMIIATPEPEPEPTEVPTPSPQELATARNIVVTAWIDELTLINPSEGTITWLTEAPNIESTGTLQLRIQAQNQVENGPEIVFELEGKNKLVAKLDPSPIKNQFTVNIPIKKLELGKNSFKIRGYYKEKPKEIIFKKKKEIIVELANLFAERPNPWHISLNKKEYSDGKLRATEQWTSLKAPNPKIKKIVISVLNKENEKLIIPFLKRFQTIEVNTVLPAKEPEETLFVSQEKINNNLSGALWADPFDKKLLTKFATDTAANIAYFGEAATYYPKIEAETAINTKPDADIFFLAQNKLEVITKATLTAPNVKKFLARFNASYFHKQVDIKFPKLVDSRQNPKFLDWAQWPQSLPTLDTVITKKLLAVMEINASGKINMRSAKDFKLENMGIISVMDSSTSRVNLLSNLSPNERMGANRAKYIFQLLQKATGINGLILRDLKAKRYEIYWENSEVKTISGDKSIREQLTITLGYDAVIADKKQNNLLLTGTLPVTSKKMQGAILCEKPIKADRLVDICGIIEAGEQKGDAITARLIFETEGAGPSKIKNGSYVIFFKPE